MPQITKDFAKPVHLYKLGGGYTLGKLYEVLPVRAEFDTRGARRFDIIDDDGDRIWCDWVKDPDVVWERVQVTEDA